MKVHDLILPLALVLASACTEKVAAPEATSPGITLETVPSVAQAPQTRGAVFGNSDGAGGYLMPVSSTFGLWVCNHYAGDYADGNNPYREYAANYKNISASRGSNGWTYVFGSYTSGFPTMLLLPQDDDRDGVTDNNADIFAYAPYVSGLAALEAVPFSIAGAVDVMYAEENGVENLNIDPADLAGNPNYSYSSTEGHKLRVPLTFHHALSLLEFDFRLKNTTYNRPEGDGYLDRTPTSYDLNSITVERKEGGHPLYISGTMNAMTQGTLAGLTAANSLTVSGSALLAHPNNGKVTVAPSHTYDNPARAYLLQVPSQAGDTYQDGDYTFYFRFAGMPFPVTFTLLTQDLLSPGETEFDGFKPGYKYVFHFVIDNYVHFEGLTVGEWGVESEPYQYEI